MLGGAISPGRATVLPHWLAVAGWCAGAAAGISTRFGVACARTRRSTRRASRAPACDPSRGTPRTAHREPVRQHDRAAWRGGAGTTGEGATADAAAIIVKTGGFGSAASSGRATVLPHWPTVGWCAGAAAGVSVRFGAARAHAALNAQSLARAGVRSESRGAFSYYISGAMHARQQRPALQR